MFTVDWAALEATGQRTFNCEGCLVLGREHRVRRIICGYTRMDSPWGYGVQQWLLLCESCRQTAGPFVESEDVEHLSDIEDRRRLARDQNAGGSHRSLTMGTITAKPRIGKEPRPKRQMAPLSMQRELHRPDDDPHNWQRWGRIQLGRYVARLALGAVPKLADCGSAVMIEELIAEEQPAFIPTPFGFALSWNGGSIGLTVSTEPGISEVKERFHWGELLPYLLQEEPLKLMDPDEQSRLAAAWASELASPDETGTSTPRGIAANDADAQGVLKNQLSELAGRPKLERNEREFLMGIEWEKPLVGKSLDKAEHLVEKYFSGAPRPTKPVVAGSNGHAAAAAAKEVRNLGSKTTSKVSLKNCVRHPDNRVPTKEEIDNLAESIKVDTLLEKPVLRPLAGGKYQIVSGETRILAMKKLGWHETDAELVQCDDARALELLAIYNAKRTDLNPIQKARMIERLCQPPANMTREAAGKIYKLESHSAASNLVRLLELPQAWQDRVAGGELPESFARLILRYLNLGPVMEHLEGAWKQRGKRGRYNGDTFESRDNLERAIHAFSHNFCRRVKEEKWAEGDWHRLKADFDNPEIRARLGIVEITDDDGKKGKVLVATNADAFDEMLKAQALAAARKRAEKAGRDKPGKTKVQSPAARKEAAAAKTKQLGERIAAWRHKLLRRACSQAIEDEQDSGLRVVLAHAADRCVPHGGLNFTEALLEVRKVQPRHRGWSEEYWPVVAQVSDDMAVNETNQNAEGVVVAKLAQIILAHESKDWRRPTVPHSFVESYAADLAVDVAAEWKEMQGDGPGGDHALVEEFFLLHQTDQLRDLAKELGTFMPENATRAGMVKLLMIKLGSNTRFKLPKSVKPAGKKGK